MLKKIKEFKPVELIKRGIFFVKEDVWRIRPEKLPKYIRIFLFPVRVTLIALRGFREDSVSLRASALTFYSMLSVVPIVAMGFGIAKGFGFEEMLKKELSEKFADKQEVFDYITKFANRFLENTQGGLIAGIGIVVLAFLIMKVFGNIESSFNAIWQVHKPRVWFRKITDYLTMMLIAPILIILSTSSNVFITTQITQITSEVELLGYISPFIFFLVKLIPYVLFWLVLTLIYMVMPNTNVNFKSAFVASIIAGSIFVFVQWAYIYFQIGVSRYNTIYGSFAALPLFLIWLQISWLIVLLGGEISFAVQNVEKYEFDPDIHNISAFSQRVFTLMIMRLTVKRFSESKEPLTSKQISQKLEIPLKLVRDTLYTLTESRLLSIVETSNEKEKAYQPAQDINKMTISFVLNKVDHKGENKILEAASDEKKQIEKILNEFDKATKNASGSMLVKDIA